MAFLDVIMVGDLLFDEIDEEQQKHNLRIMHRNIRDTSDPFTMPEKRFQKVFRLSKELSFHLITILDEFMPVGIKTTYIPNHLKVLFTLNFFGYGSYQGIVGEDYNFPCSQPTVCRVINLVTSAIVENLLQNKIKFPTTAMDIERTKLDFLNKFGFPNVIGCIDGTHVAIISPPAEHDIYPAIAYYNRKGYASINTLIICDANLKINAINARFPGATHDSAIWQMSSVLQHLRREYFAGGLNYWLLGDSGFPLQPWLLTPIENAPPDSPESRYTERHTASEISLHTATRNTIERLNGVLKNRFRCLIKHRALHYLPPKAGKIIYACAVLHNMCLEYNVLDIDNNEEIENDAEIDVQIQVEVDNNVLNLGRRIRNNLIQQHFM